MSAVMEYAPYSRGANYCSGRGIYIFTTSNTFPCCSIRLRTCAKKKKTVNLLSNNNKAKLDSGNSEIVAFHKVKLKFVNLAEMQTEDPDQLQIYEFKSQNFKLVTN